jgi:hypothetical protein
MSRREAEGDCHSRLWHGKSCPYACVLQTSQSIPRRKQSPMIDLLSEKRRWEEIKRFMHFFLPLKNTQN